jgi:hypothetical protein
LARKKKEKIEEFKKQLIEKKIKEKQEEISKDISYSSFHIQKSMKTNPELTNFVKDKNILKHTENPVGKNQTERTLRWLRWWGGKRRTRIHSYKKVLKKRKNKQTRHKPKKLYKHKSMKTVANGNNYR